MKIKMNNSLCENSLTPFKRNLQSINTCNEDTLISIARSLKASNYNYDQTQKYLTLSNESCLNNISKKQKTNTSITSECERNEYTLNEEYDQDNNQDNNINSQKLLSRDIDKIIINDNHINHYPDSQLVILDEIGDSASDTETEELADQSAIIEIDGECYWVPQNANLIESDFADDGFQQTPLQLARDTGFYIGTVAAKSKSNSTKKKHLKIKIRKGISLRNDSEKSTSINNGFFIPDGLTPFERRRHVWVNIISRDISREYRRFQTRSANIMAQYKKVANVVMREVRRKVARNIRSTNESHFRAKRLGREMQLYWRRNEKSAIEVRKQTEKEVIENQKRENEKREAQRQERKLEFLLTQTEIWSHFIGRHLGVNSYDKITEEDIENISLIKKDEEENNENETKDDKNVQLPTVQPQSLENKVTKDNDNIDNINNTKIQSLDNTNVVHAATIPEIVNATEIPNYNTVTATIVPATVLPTPGISTPNLNSTSTNKSVNTFQNSLLSSDDIAIVKKEATIATKNYIRTQYAKIRHFDDHFKGKQKFFTQDDKNEKNLNPIIEGDRDENSDITLKKSKPIKQKQPRTKVTIPSQTMLDQHSDELQLNNPTINPEAGIIGAPSIFIGDLKSYQLKGMNWLINLYDQGINGILADEMGLGKTVETIAFLAHLAMEKDIWGPFLIIAPISTLYQWIQEFKRFCPALKCLDYWGKQTTRKEVRKFWNPKQLHSRNSKFHVVVTGYQVYVNDEKYFNRLKWQYLVLDEAQAIKNSMSVRWNSLLKLKARNKLLLTGTPIQNSMAELWALLHFIMPSLFDSHDEFNEWFSKDIEKHAAGDRKSLDKEQIKRLHLILKPFMLRRVKRDVEPEMAPKIEIKVKCPLSLRQQILYQALKSKILIKDLFNITSTENLMNLVMQFRKVCNHPEIFERREASSSFYFNEQHIFPRVIHNQPIEVWLKVRNPLSRPYPRLLSLYKWEKQEHMRFISKFSIWHPNYIHSSIFYPKSISCFSFSRFINTSPSELSFIYYSNSIQKWLANLHCEYSNNHIVFSSSSRCLFLSPCLLRFLSFSLYNYSCSFCRKKNNNLPPLIQNIFNRVLYNQFYFGFSNSENQNDSSNTSLSYFLDLKNKLPILPTVYASPPVLIHSSKREHNIQTLNLMDSYYSSLFLGFNTRSWRPYNNLSDFNNCEMRPILSSPIFDTTELGLSLPSTFQSDILRIRDYPTTDYFTTLYENQSHLLVGGIIQPNFDIFGPSQIYVPDLGRLLADSGKLQYLDSLLRRLKTEGHRVLIFCQMTRMIDILEDFMRYRNFRFFRLDGQTELTNRRDMVRDFQKTSDIFVFLLSTRAGGLGINLTAADTVIFYDNDWNPTMDSQAMDRVHRIGQTKQVTVFRMVCKNTVEERILQRSQEKLNIQKTVYSGGFKMQGPVDLFKTNELRAFLLDDNEMTEERQKLFADNDNDQSDDNSGENNLNKNEKSF